MKKLLIATTNQGKILDYKNFFKDFPLKLVTLKDLNIKVEPKEDGKTYQENAIKKVKFYSKLSDLPTLADDSGLEIDYLNGEPGVQSRYWPGYRASDEELIEIALNKLKGVVFKKRGAQLRAVIALLLDKKIMIFEGILRGIILEEPIEKVIPGFPFRRIFYLSRIKKVIGELTPEEEKKVLTHRRKALKKAIPIIKKHLM